jgi:hypothetical protein
LEINIEMKRSWFMIPAFLPAAMALAQNGTVLYNPVRTIADQEIKVKGWGSGTLSETDEAAFNGTHSLRISTRNYFQGGIITLGKPVDLLDEAKEKTNLLRVTFRQADMKLGGGAGAGAGDAGGGPRRGAGLAGAGGGGGAAAGGGGNRGGLPGGLQGGAPGTGTTKTALGVNPPAMKFIRVIVTTTDGKKSEAYIPTDTAAPTQETGWRSVAVPLQAISGLDRTNKVIKDVAISADQMTTFYVGDLRIISDKTPIRAEPNVRDINRELGAEVIFSASGQGGSSVLRYTWDFDASDGIGVDAEGQAVRRKFRKAGTYTITLTVSDYYGLKDPYTTTIKAVINP